MKIGLRKRTKGRAGYAEHHMATESGWAWPGVFVRVEREE